MRLRVANEFATVDVRLRLVASCAVLEVADPQSGARVWLDALELEALTRVTLAVRRALVDPSAVHVDQCAPGDYDEGALGW